MYQQTRRWLGAGVFETMAHDLREPARLTQNRGQQPSAVVLDGRKRKQGSKVHAVVDTLGSLLALVATPADEQERAQVEALAAAGQPMTGEHVEVAFAEQGYTGEAAAEAAEKDGIRLVVVKHTEAKKGFVLLPKRWVVERSFLLYPYPLAVAVSNGRCVAGRTSPCSGREVCSPPNSTLAGRAANPSPKLLIPFPVKNFVGWR